MGNIYELFEADVKKEREGAWVPLQDDIHLKLCSFANQKYLDYVNEEIVKWNSVNSGKVMPDDVNEDIHVQAMANHVLVDWKGMTYKNGKAMKYSSAAAYKLLSDPNMRRFKIAVMQLSNDLSTFRVKHEDEDSKNSKRSSNGK